MDCHQQHRDHRQYRDQHHHRQRHKRRQYRQYRDHRQHRQHYHRALHSEPYTWKIAAIAISAGMDTSAVITETSRVKATPTS